MILAFVKNNPYAFRLSEERTVLTERTINTSDIIAAFGAEGQILQFSYQILRKHFSKEDKESTRPRSRSSLNTSSHTSMPTRQPRTNQRRSHASRPESDGIPRINMKKKKKRKWNLRKVILELHNPDNLSRFIQKFAEVTLDRDMTKIGAAEELKTIQENFREFMPRYNVNPRNVHPDVNETEQRSLAHVNPDANFDEEEFYFHHQHEKPTREERRAAQDKSGYPIRLPIGLKS